MRSSKSRSRSKSSNRQRSLGNVVNRVFDSSGPEGKVRGTPQQIIDKYLMLARDAQLSNDRVAEQNFLQHAEHYTRMLGEAQREMAREQEMRQNQSDGNQGGNGQNNNNQNNNQNYNAQNNNPQNNNAQNNNPQNSNLNNNAQNSNQNGNGGSDRPQPQQRGRADRDANQRRSNSPERSDDNDSESGLVETPENRQAGTTVSASMMPELPQPDDQPSDKLDSGMGAATAKKPARGPRKPRVKRADTENGQDDPKPGKVPPADAAE
jgi:hypothetical protein